MQAQKIKEIVDISHESLFDFLTKLPTSFEAQIFYGLAGAGVLGLIASWLWKWSQGEANGFHHFTFRYAIGQVLWIIGSAIGAITTIEFSTASGEFFGWLSVLWTVALAGFGGEVKITKPTGVT